MKAFYRWVFYLLVILVSLVVVYGVARFTQFVMDGNYQSDRSPYLQKPSPTAITIRWQTSEDTLGTIKYGISPDNLSLYREEDGKTDYHEIRLEGLEPGTRYYYEVGTKNLKLATGKQYWFVTPPDTEQPSRFWVLGDPGYVGPKQLAVRDAMLKWSRQNPRPDRPYLDFMLTTGDNAYISGKNEEYQMGFFNPYKPILRNIPVWPIYGNHDARRWSFFKIFSLPEKGESGGVPSDTENYYSFEYSNIHFVVLDSHASGRSTTGEMANWLRKDLASNKKTWLIALFHHPPYTKGSHDSDDTSDSRGRMKDMRENILPILEKAGVDLVFSGHSHVYERSYLLDCHYGTSDELMPFMLRDKTPKGPYYKHSAKPAPHEGAVYLVVGSSSRLDYGTSSHPAMAVLKRVIGSMIVDVDGLELTARFINDKAKVVDEFTIKKGVQDAAPGNIECRG